MFNAIYQILIFPIIQIFEFFYQFIFEITNNKGIAVIGLSIVVSLVTLPLYMIAESWQEKERLIQKKLKPGIDRIKAVFKGDEQYMILSTFYKQNNYKPIMALRSSFGLLIQIPFFIAAYNFLSNLKPLQGYSFLFIKDFGAPDATFHIGNFAINILPIAMTIINCVAGFIYTKGLSLKEKIQIYAFALFFLVFLYNSPAGLVLYWTMNNVFSLVKNVFYKVKNPKKLLFICICVISAVLLISPITILKSTKTIYKFMVVLFAIILPISPFILKYISNFLDKKIESNTKENKKTNTTIFVLSSIIIAILTGLVIPSIIVHSEPNNYCYVDNYKSPFIFIITPLFQAIGLFVLWPVCFYFLCSDKIKKVFLFIFSTCAFSAIVNCFAFSGNYGPMTPSLLFMESQSFIPSLFKIIINLSIMILIVLLTFVLLKSKFKNYLQSICYILIFSLSIISVKNLITINSEFKNITPTNTAKTVDEKIYNLSKTGKNVILIMQDALSTANVQKAFELYPNLKESFDGFTYYPNTTSFGRYTMIGAPCLFGGYDYTPYEINQRTDKTLQQKHNEALLTLPVLFLNNGFDVTVSNLPYENYLEYPVTDMYKEYPSIKREETYSRYTNVWNNIYGLTKDPVLSNTIKRNFIWFSIFKVVPPIARQFVYHSEYWVSSDPISNYEYFVDNYSTLDLLPELTNFNNKQNSFIIIDNEATHYPIFLQEPEYIPNKATISHSLEKTNKLEYDASFTSTCGVFTKFLDFFNYLKQNNCYDNTRIIIVSDHGFDNQKTKIFNSAGFPFKKERITATLMVKDFNSKGILKFNDDFMTNADTPYITTKDIIKDAKNPFTNNSLKECNKQNRVKIAFTHGESTRNRNNTQFKIENWYTVKDNIFIDSNWTQEVPQ